MTDPAGAASPAKRVFISYSHDSPAHRQRVWELASKLHDAGLDSRLDQFQEAPPEGWRKWCETNIVDADIILIVWTERYRHKWDHDELEQNGRGVRFEAGAMESDHYRHPSKYISVAFDADDFDDYAVLPFLTRRFDVSTTDGLQQLVDSIRGTGGHEPWLMQYVDILRNRYGHIGNRYVPIDTETEHLSAFDKSSGKSQKESTARPLTLVSEDEPNLVILGEPGAGKSWALRYLALQQAQRFHKQVDDCVPVYVELKKWPIPGEEADSLGTRRGLVRFIRESINRTLQSDESEPQASGARWTISLKRLEKTFSALPFLLVLDGLDEIPEPSKRLEFVKACADFAAQETRHRIVIGSRKYGFDRYRQYLGGFRIREMTRLTPTVKLAIIDAYKKERDVTGRTIYEHINAHYRLARLADNVLLLRILAEHYRKDTELPTTRGRILEIHIQKTLDDAKESFLDHLTTAEQAQEFLIWLAAERRANPGASFAKDDVRGFLEDELRFDSVRRTKFLDDLLNTRLITLEPDPPHPISFALPQFEEYFLARRALPELKAALPGSKERRRGSRWKADVRELRIVLDGDQHHILILAAGLVSRDEVKALAEALEPDEFLFLKARILGEAEADDPEREFRELLRTQIDRDLVIALKHISQWAIGTLLVWWLALLPFSFLVYGIYNSAPISAVLMYLAYAAGLPAVFPYVHRAVQRHYQGKIRFDLVRRLSALACLRSGAVAGELKLILDQLKEHRPVNPRQDDLFVQFLNFARSQIQSCAMLAERDPDEMENWEGGVHLIEEYIAIPSAAFIEPYFEVLRRLLEPDSEFEASLRRQVFPLEKYQRLCIEKLCEVALQAPELRERVMSLLGEVTRRSDQPELASAARRALEDLRSGTHLPSRRNLRMTAPVLAALALVYAALYWRLFGAVIALLLRQPARTEMAGWMVFIAGPIVFGVVRTIRRQAARGRMRLTPCVSWATVWMVISIRTAGAVLGPEKMPLPRPFVQSHVDRDGR